MRPKVLVASNSFGELVDDGLRMLERLADIERVDPATVDEGEFLDKLEACAALIGVPRRCAGLVSSRRNLRIIAVRGAGYDALDIEEATRNGIIVTFAPSANATSVAELTVGLLLSITRRIPMAATSVSNGGWDRLSCAGVELEGKTVGIIGFGAVGSRVARMVGGFNVTLLAYDPYITGETASAARVKLVTLEELLRSSDFVTIHCALTPSTRGMIGAKALELLKPTAYIVNASRGEVVDESAMANALMKGRIAGYATDVLQHEPPPPGHPLSGLSNVICTPHIGGYTREAARRVDVVVASDVLAVLEGRIPERQRVLNPSLLKGE